MIVLGFASMCRQLNIWVVYTKPAIFYFFVFLYSFQAVGNVLAGPVCTKILFFHLPKAGGSSVMNFFMSQMDVKVFRYRKEHRSKLNWSTLLHAEQKDPRKYPMMVIENHKQQSSNSFLNSVSRIERLRKVYQQFNCTPIVVLAMREPKSLYKSFFCFHIQRKYFRDQLKPPLFSWKNAFCCQGKNLMYNWLVHGGWPSSNLHTYSEVRGQNTFERLMKDIERVVDVIITPENQDIMLAYMWEKLHFTRGNCTFRVTNKSTCKIESSEFPPTFSFACKSIQKQCLAGSKLSPGKNIKLLNSIAKSIDDRVGTFDEIIWQRFSEYLPSDLNVEQLIPCKAQ